MFWEAFLHFTGAPAQKRPKSIYIYALGPRARRAHSFFDSSGAGPGFAYKKIRNGGKSRRIIQSDLTRSTARRGRRTYPRYRPPHLIAAPTFHRPDSTAGFVHTQKWCSKKPAVGCVLSLACHLTACAHSRRRCLQRVHPPRQTHAEPVLQ